MLKMANKINENGLIKKSTKNRKQSHMSTDTKSFKSDVWNPWTIKSDTIAFKSTAKCVGNGEKKLAKELDIEKTVGGQNSTIDLEHKILGKISVKDFTNDNCILGVEGSSELLNVLHETAFPLIKWTKKFKSKCDYADKIYNEIGQPYGKSSISIYEGILRRELSSSNLIKLNEIFENLKFIEKEKSTHNVYPSSLDSEYVNDICDFLGNNTFIDVCNKCVRKEAINMTLIIVHKKNGWMIVKDTSKITCPRITRGSPRIQVDF